MWSRIRHAEGQCMEHGQMWSSALWRHRTAHMSRYLIVCWAFCWKYVRTSVRRASEVFKTRWNALWRCMTTVVVECCTYWYSSQFRVSIVQTKDERCRRQCHLRSPYHVLHVALSAHTHTRARTLIGRQWFIAYFAPASLHQVIVQSWHPTSSRTRGNWYHAAGVLES